MVNAALFLWDGSASSWKPILHWADMFLMPFPDSPGIRVCMGGPFGRFRAIRDARRPAFCCHAGRILPPELPLILRV
jgi:hypothetical protein